MERFLFLVLPQLLLLLFGVLLGVWGLLLRRTDLALEGNARLIGRIAAVLFFVWLVAVTIVQRQLPMLSPGQLAYFLGALIWFGQCYSQRRVDQRLFAMLPLLGVISLMVFGLVMGLTPDNAIRSLLGPGVAVHGTLSMAGVGLLLGCGVYGAGHVILHHQISNRRFDAWFQRFPSLGDLDRLRRGNLFAGTALVTVSLVSARIWSALRTKSDPTVVSHLHPMMLLFVLLLVLVAADRWRWLSTRNLAIACLVMALIVLALLTVSVVEIFAGRFV